MSPKQALIAVLDIVRTVHPASMGPRNEAIWNIVEALVAERDTAARGQLQP